MIRKQGVIASYSLLFIFTSFALGSSQYESVVAYISIFALILPIFKINIYKNLFRSEFFFIFTALFIILISGYISPHKGEAFDNSIRLVYRYLTVIFASAFVINMKSFKIGLKAIVLGSLITQLLNFSGVDSISFSSQEVNEAILSINGYAHNVIIGFFACFILFNIEKSKKWKFIFLIFMLFTVISLLSIGSRQSLIVTVFFVFTFIVLRSFRSGLKAVLKIFFFMLFSIFLFVILLKLLQDTILVQRLVGTNIEEDARYFILENAFNLFLKRPFIGYGPGTYNNYDMFVYTHNTPAELLFTGGVLYAVLYYLVLLMLIIKSWKLRHVNFNLSMVITSVLITYILAGQFYLFHSSRLALILFFLCLFYINTNLKNDNKRGL